MANLFGRRVLLGVSGGIAAYKSPDLVRRLRDRGAEVQVVMTAGAKEFVTPLTFQAVSGRPVRDDLWDEQAEMAMGHIELARWADVVLVAPATADFLARLAAGQANDLLTTLCLATSAPLAVAPAMNRQMWASAATQENVKALAARGVRVLGPGAGEQACGEIGEGRMLEPLEIATAIEALLVPAGPLAGRKLVVTAGPTREPLDPVRFITNRSSGKMGFAIAEAARDAGAEVVLVSGPVHLPTPRGLRRIDVETSREMYEATLRETADCDLFVATAAVADYRPSQTAPQKIKKSQDNAELTLHLTRTEDILATVAAQARRPFVVGFAAETENVEAHARAKLLRKNLDLIAANDVAGGKVFDRDDNTLLVLSREDRTDIGPASKTDVARRLIALIAERYAAARAARPATHDATARDVAPAGAASR